MSSSIRCEISIAWRLSLERGRISTERRRSVSPATYSKKSIRTVWNNSPAKSRVPANTLSNRPDPMDAPLVEPLDGRPPLNQSSARCRN
jgi:hypothetical protein